MSDRALPPGPAAGPVAQTIALHRDPLGTLRRALADHGDVFTLRLATARPLVVVTAAAEAVALMHADPASARAGEARRRILPLASRASIFGSDEPHHAVARSRIADLFAPDAVAAHRDAIADVAARHVEGWPSGRPLRLLDRMRALVDELFVRLFLGVEAERRVGALVSALRRMVWTPGNPPMSVPGEGDGLLGAGVTALFRRRAAPLIRLLADEVGRRRAERADDVIGRIVAADPARTGEDVADEILVLLAAAQEPPASALTWLLERLARDAPLAERFLDGTAPARDAIVRETLRLRPAALAGLRRLTAAREVAGFRLPAGVTVMLPIPLLHRDPQAYPDPDAFRPERWAPGAPARLFRPFGDGTRRCLGEHLARAYLDEVALAVLRRVWLRPLLARPERMVLRGTILVPHRSGAALARLR